MGTSGTIAHHLSNSGGSRSVLGLGLPSPFMDHARTCGVIVHASRVRFGPVPDPAAAP